MNNCNLEPSYYNMRLLENEFKKLHDYISQKNNNFIYIIKDLFSQLIKIPSGYDILLSQQEDSNLLRFIWLNKKNVISVWNIQLKYSKHYYLNISTEIIKYGKTKIYNFNFYNDDELPVSICKDLAIFFKLKYIQTPKVVNKLYITELILNDITKKNKLIDFNIFNNSYLSKYKKKLINKIKFIDNAYVFIFSYYDGPLSGIHIINDKLYYFFVQGYLNLWNSTPEVIRLIEVPSKHSSIITAWLNIQKQQGEEYSKIIQTTHNDGSSLALQTLFFNNPEELCKAEITLEQIILEHDLLVNKKADFYLLV